MSIDRTSPLKPISTVQPRETTDTPVTNTRAAKTTAAASSTTCSSGYVRRNPESPHSTSSAGFFVSTVVRGYPAKSSDYWYTFRYTLRCIPKTYTNFLEWDNRGTYNASSY